MDRRDASQPILGARIGESQWICGTTGLSRLQHLTQIRIDVSKRVPEAFRVASSQACGAICLRRESRHPPFDDGGGLTQAGPVEVVGLLLLPTQASEFSINLYRQP